MYDSRPGEESFIRSHIMFRYTVNPGHLHIEDIDTAPTTLLHPYDRPPDPLLSRKHPLYCTACGDPKEDTPQPLCDSCTEDFTLCTVTPDLSTTDSIRFMPPLPRHCLACAAEIGEDGNAQGLCDACMRNFG